MQWHHKALEHPNDLPKTATQSRVPDAKPQYAQHLVILHLALSITSVNPAVVIQTDELVVYTFLHTYLEVTKIGRKDADPAPDIPFSGLR